jgi:hypothetical protein
MENQLTEHQVKYQAIIENIGIENLIPLLPEKNKEVLKEKFLQDEHFNNIPLRLWDAREIPFKQLHKQAGYKNFCLSDCVCTLKETARIYMDL